MDLEERYKPQIRNKNLKLIQKVPWSRYKIIRNHIGITIICMPYIKLCLGTQNFDTFRSLIDEQQGKILGLSLYTMNCNSFFKDIQKEII